MKDLHFEAIKLLDDIDRLESSIKNLDHWVYNHSGDTTDMMEEVANELREKGRELATKKAQYKQLVDRIKA